MKKFWQFLFKLSRDSQKTLAAYSNNKSFFQYWSLLWESHEGSEDTWATVWARPLLKPAPLQRQPWFDAKCLQSPPETQRDRSTQWNSLRDDGNTKLKQQNKSLTGDQHKGLNTNCFWITSLNLKQLKFNTWTSLNYILWKPFEKYSLILKCPHPLRRVRLKHSLTSSNIPF